MAHNTISLKYKCSKHCFPLGTQVAQIKEELAVANRQSDVTASLEQQLQAVNLKVNSIQEQVRVQKPTVKSGAIHVHGSIIAILEILQLINSCSVNTSTMQKCQKH